MIRSRFSYFVELRRNVGGSRNARQLTLNYGYHFMVDPDDKVGHHLEIFLNILSNQSFISLMFFKLLSKSP